jgi:hypothetical protein
MSTLHYQNNASSSNEGPIFPPPLYPQPPPDNTGMWPPKLDAPDDLYEIKSSQCHSTCAPRTTYPDVPFVSTTKSVLRPQERHPTIDDQEVGIAPWGPRLVDDLETHFCTLELQEDGEQESAILRIPQSSNPCGADAVHPQKQTMKKQRKRKTAAGAVGGMLVGGLTLGPVGVFVGGAVGAVATNKLCKIRERRAQRRFEQRSFQQAATNSNIHLAAFV